MTIKEFTEKYFPFAASVTTGTGISPALIIAQAYLESGKGQSLLARKFNNFFGVKVYPGWTGKTVSLQTKEQKKTGEIVTLMQNFVVFNSPGDAFTHQIKFLQKQPRYKKAGLFNTPGDYKAQADSLQRAGYATDLNYSAKLTTLANSVVNAAKKANKATPAILLAALLFFF